MNISSSIISRFIYSAFGNLLKAGLGFATSIVIARGLGPADYGVFGFLLASFAAITQILDMGSSSAFQTFISKRIRSKKFIWYYIIWLVVQFAVIFLCIAILAPETFIQHLWQGEPRERVLIAFVAVFLQQKMWRAINQLGESQRFTHLVQFISVSVAAIHLLIILMLAWQSNIGIEIIYFIIAIEFLLAVGIAYFLFPLQFSNERETFNEIFNEYRSYCYPLIPTTYVAIIAAFADTWLLQHFSGPVEQAYYAVAVQFSIISLMATRSVLNILWKEVAEAYEENKLDVVRQLFTRSTKMLHQLGAVISCFLIPWASEIISMSLGDAYLAGYVTMAIMFLYPINQARGQVAGTMLYALGMTKAIFFLGIFSSLVSIIVTYFVLAPVDAVIPGLGLASAGLALKMVGVQFVNVNLFLWWISRKLEIEMDWLYQFSSLILFLVMGYASFFLINFLIDGSVSFFVRGVVSGLLYAVSIFSLAYYFPSIFALSKHEINRYYYLMLSKLHKSSHK